MKLHFLLTASICFFVGTLSVVSASEAAFTGALARAAQKALNTSNATISVSAVTDFAWDTCFIFKPYTQLAEIDKQLGFKWADTQKTAIESSDSVYLLVFVQGRKVVRHIDVSRKTVEFEGLNLTNKFLYSDCAFGVTSNGEGRLLLIPKGK